MGLIYMVIRATDFNNAIRYEVRQGSFAPCCYIDI